MVRYYFLILLPVVNGFISCNNEPKQSASISTTTDTTKPVGNNASTPTIFCYSTMNGNDTVVLKTENFPDAVKGNLSYKIFEKDSNKGTIDGKMKGDTLIADYTFMSEGTKSIRQVAFIIKDNIAIEGYGNVEEKDGKTVFKNTGELDFGKSIGLEKVPCPIQ